MGKHVAAMLLEPADDQGFPQAAQASGQGMDRMPRLTHTSAPGVSKMTIEIH